MKDNNALLCSVKEFLEEEMYSQQKQKDGTYTVELYADYRDELGSNVLKDILEYSRPMDMFYEKIYECWQDAVWETEDELKSKCETYLGEHDIDYDEDEIMEVLRELVCVEPPYEHYLKQEVYVDIMVDTGDGNYDFTLNAHYPSYYGPREGEAMNDRASLVWLAKQQGYTKGQLRKALDCGDMRDPKGFLQSVQVEVANMCSSIQTLTFLVKMTVEQCIRINELVKLQERNGRFYDARMIPYCGYIILGKETMCGLYDSWGGGGSVLEIQLEKDVKLPIKYIWSAMPDGAGPGYSINSVYGLCMSCWEESLKDIHSPKNENDLWLQMYRN